MQAILWSSIDPAWAWSPWQADTNQAWDTGRVAHLYRRAAFGATPEMLKHGLAIGLEPLLDELFATDRNSQQHQTTSAQLAQSALASGDAKGLAVWWLRDMLETQTPLVEKMTLFWHGHFATGADKIKEPQVMLAQNKTLREHALGDVAKLVHAISQDAAMLVYLDSAVNRKAHPNENFARELMELFCLGEGHYSERDVQELARCFTGWEVRRNQFRFNAFQHDTGTKRLFDRDIESGEQAVDAVLSHSQATTFIAGKLFRYFIADEPAPQPELIKPLADQLRTDAWHISGTVRRMLGSQLMFSPIVRGRKVRSPIEWALNWMKSCQLSTNLKKISEGLNELGQSLFYPPNVKGWDGGRAWINSSTLVGRTNLISQLIRESSTRWQGGSMRGYWQSQKVKSVTDLVAWLELHLLATPLRPAHRQRLEESMQRAGGIEHIEDCLTLAAALPEMQLA